MEKKTVNQVITEEAKTNKMSVFWISIFENDRVVCQGNYPFREEYLNHYGDKTVTKFYWGIGQHLLITLENITESEGATDAV